MLRLEKSPKLHEWNSLSVQSTAVQKYLKGLGREMFAQHTGASWRRWELSCHKLTTKKFIFLYHKFQLGSTWPLRAVSTSMLLLLLQEETEYCLVFAGQRPELQDLYCPLVFDWRRWRRFIATLSFSRPLPLLHKHPTAVCSAKIPNF